MLGQLQDAGNTTTLAHYLRLLETAFLVSGLEAFSRGQRRKRGSSPKLVLWNPALVSALTARSFDEARADSAWWGRVVENAVGAHLLNHLPSPEWGMTWWRRGNEEVDYIVEHGRTVWALEVKSGRGGRVSGLRAFRADHPSARSLLVGSDGIPLEEFLGSDPRGILEAAGH